MAFDNLKSWKLWVAGGLLVAIGLVARNKEKSAKEWYNEGVDKNRTKQYGEAVSCYAKAAEMGLPAAQTNLGYHYHFGVGVAKSEKLSIQWFSKASDQGYAPAQLAMAGFYAEGKLVPKNLDLSDSLFLKAAERGIPQGQYGYALACIRKDDIASAKQWLLKAEACGVPEAYFTLGHLIMKESVNGADLKVIEGYAHMLVSVQLGGHKSESLAKSITDAFERVSKPEQVTQGKALASQLLQTLGSKRPPTEFNPDSV